MHHGHEARIGLRQPGVFEKHAKHFQDVSSFVIDQVHGVSRFQVGIRLVVQVERPHINRPVSLGVLRKQPFAFQVPEGAEILGLEFLHIEAGGKFGKPFGHPLVPISLPAYGVSPPLVGHFVDGNDVVKLPPFRGVLQMKLMPRGIIEQGVVGKKDERGPALPIPPHRLLGYGHCLKRELPEIVLVELKRLEADPRRVLGVRSRAEPAPGNP